MTISKLFYTSSIVLSVAAFSASARPAASYAVNMVNSDISANDSCFVHIDSNTYVIAEELPRYYEEFCVGDVAPAGYDVRLLYPEFKELSNKELRSLKKLQQDGIVPNDADVTADENMMFPTVNPVYGLKMKQTLSVSRKKGYLGVGFSPVVFHEGKWKRLLSCQLRIAPRKAATAAPGRVDVAERWASNSVLATGNWVKVRVKDEGIYQLTAENIKKMGFNDLSKVKVYGYGGLLQPEKFEFPAVDEKTVQNNVPDDLVEVPTLMTDNGRLLFWAEGTTRLNWDNTNKCYTALPNHYSSYSYYFVTENDSPRLNVETLTDEVVSTNTFSSVPYISVNDYDNTSWYFGGRRFFDQHDFANGSHSYKIKTPDVSPQGIVSVDMALGASATTVSSVTAKLNDTPLGTTQLSAYNSTTAVAYWKTFNKKLEAAVLRDTEGNTITMTPGNANKMRVDYINVNYTRELNAEAAPYSFSPQERQPVTLRIANAKSTTRLWRIGQTGSPTVAIPAHLNDNTLEAIVSTPQRRFAFFDEAATFAAPEVVGKIENQNLHAHENVDYVIIIPASGKLQDEAVRLAELHKEREGMSYSVVRADQLYNEFSSGTPDATAYRRYLKMLYDRAGNDENAMPKYCLLIGKSPWDCRFVTDEWKGKKLDDYLLSFEVDNTATAAEYANLGSVNSYLTDDYYGFLDDGEGELSALVSNKLDITLGRMVCVTAEDLKRLVDKAEAYMNNDNAGIWKNTIVMLADDGDKNGHMEDAEAVVRDIEKINSNLDIQKVYWDRYFWASSATGYSYPLGTAQIKKLMSEGAVMFNYSGHGSPNMISHYKLLTTSDFKEALSPTMPLWVLASCEIYPFDSNEENMAEASLFLENGGGIAFMCATRSVYRDRNNILNRLYCRNVLSRNMNGELNTMGDALRISKVQAVDKSEGMSDGTINKLKYVFFGDPALKLAIPTGRLVVDAINGKPVSEMKELEVLPAGAVATISGHVCNFGDDSGIDENFNGNVSISIFDREETVVCKNNKREHETSDPSSPLITPMVYSERAKSIFKGTTKAVDGNFTFTLVVPRDISYSNESGRITLYAISEDKLREYNGVCDKFCLNGTSNTEVDTEAPKIVLYVNSIDNPDYTITDENPVLIADVSDDYGINNAGISLGHNIELVLDGNSTDCYNLNSYFTYDTGSYQKGQIVYPLKNLERGPHNAEVRVWDVNNNLAKAEVNFIVRTEAAVNKEEGYVTSTRNPATTDTQFITYFPADAEVSGLVYYEVYDTRGRCVFKDASSVSPGATSSIYAWNLCGNDHQPLPAGIYFYRTVINTSKGSLATDAQKLIITR